MSTDRYENIPQPLRGLTQWVCWGGLPDKPKAPQDPKTLRMAKCNDPTTWGSFDQAARRVGAGAQGVGIEFAAGGGLVGVLVFLAISDKLVDLLTSMATNYTFVFIAPQEKLMQYFRLSLIAAVVVVVPVALYQLYAFARPGLKKSERFFFGLVLVVGLGLFCLGVLFAYFVTLPFMLNFLVTLEGTEYITASISIESYVNLCLTIFLIFGLVFEMPLVSIILARMGIANPEIMKSFRGVAMVICFFIAAVITPPDIVSQTMVAVPMCLLYYISIFLAGIFYKKHQEAEDADDEDEDEDDED